MLPWNAIPGTHQHAVRAVSIQSSPAWTDNSIICRLVQTRDCESPSRGMPSSSHRRLDHQNSGEQILVLNICSSTVAAIQCLLVLSNGRANMGGSQGAIRNEPIVHVACSQSDDHHLLPREVYYSNPLFPLQMRNPKRSW